MSEALGAARDRAAVEVNPAATADGPSKKPVMRPGVPAGGVQSNVTLSAGHTTADVARLLDNINEVNAHMERSRDGA
mgnify:CR=1 FL=1